MENGGVEKEENLGKKLRRGVLIGKRCGPCTPVPSWRIWAPPQETIINQTDPFHSSSASASASISARKLAAALWEFHHYLPLPKMHRASKNGVSNGAADSRLIRRRHFHHHHKDKALELSNFLGDPCPSSPEQPASASSLRRHVAASLLQHHQSIERNNQALQPISPSYGSSMEVAPYNPAITPSSSDFKGRIGESHYSLKTSTELLKVLNRIWSLEEQHASNIALIKALKTELSHTHIKMKELLRQRQADRHEMDDLIKEISEDKLVRKNKEEDRIKAAILSMRDELENERKLKKRSESLQRKFARELSETKSSLVNALNEIERERKSRMLLEDLCDEFAKGIKRYENLVHALKQKSDRNSTGRVDRDGLILHISEAWLDERMQMLQEQNGAYVEKSVVEKLQVEIESFLDAKRNDANDSKNDQLLKDHRSSLESVPLNEATSAPQARDDEDSQDSDSHCFELNKPNNSNTMTHKNENTEDHIDKFCISLSLSLALALSSMAISESQTRSSLIPTFLYSSSAIPFQKMLRSNDPCVSPSPSPSPIVESTPRKAFAIPSPSEPRKKLEMYSPAFYAACAVGGSLSCGLTHTAVTPLDLIKCNMQIDPVKYKSISSGFGVLLKEQGIRGFFRGWAPTFLGYSAQGACKYGIYEFFKKYYSDIAGPEYAAKYKTLIYLAGSASAEVIADVALCPFEAVKVRVQTQPGFARGLSDGLPKFVRSEGALGLYKGIVPLWGRQIPYTMMKFATFENLVELIYKHVIPKPKNECSSALQLGVSFAGGYIAGVSCAIVSHPADNLVSFLNNAKGATVGDAVKKLGVWGLFTRGLPLRIVMIGTLTGAQWVIYDAFKVFVGLPTTGGVAPAPAAAIELPSA